MTESEPSRQRPAPGLSKRFAAQRRTGTDPELRLRRSLHAKGLRFRVQYRVENLPRRKVDIAFTKARVAVFVDGCFWHCCPQHCVIPKSNRDWWLWKFRVNQERDRDTDERLRELGWSVVRLWEHESTDDGVEKVIRLLEGKS